MGLLVLGLFLCDEAIWDEDVENLVRKPPRHRPGTYIGKDPIAKAVGEKMFAEVRPSVTSHRDGVSEFENVTIHWLAMPEKSNI